MALDNKLKENLANGTVPDPEIPVFASTPRPKPSTMDIDQTFSKLDESIKETNDALNHYDNTKPKIQPEMPDQKPASKGAEEFEIMLKELNQTVSGLSQSLNDQSAANYTGIVKNINDAKDSLASMFGKNTDSALEERLKALESAVESIGAKQDRNDKQITQTLRENANFQIQVRQGMQKDLENLRDQLSGEQFTPILKMISQIYVEYQVVFEDNEMSERTKKNLRSLFGDLEEILEEYDAEVVVSEEGSVRRPRVTKIIEKVLTGDQEKHNTVARSRKPGVVKGRQVLYPEFVDVYVYDETLAAESVLPTEEETAEVTPDIPETEEMQEKDLPENEDNITEEVENSSENNTETGEKAGGE